MRKILLAIAALLMLQMSTDAQTVNKSHRRHHKHKPTYYYNNSDGSLSTKPNAATSDARRPSAYKGDRVPENDGQKKNKQRNINYNSGQPLPANNGK
jgi:hypothetical protein